MLETSTASPQVTEAQRRDVEARVARLVSLGDVVAWGLAQGCDIAAVIVQDEFTHDVVVPWREGLVLVFDTT